MSVSSSAQRGVFGYLPGLPDFVRVRAAAREVRCLEDWIDRGLQQARWEMRADFDAAYKRLSHHFFFRADNSDFTLAGFFRASFDAHGRPFPLVAFDQVPTHDWDHATTGLVSGSDLFFQDLLSLHVDVRHLSHVSQIHSRVLGSRVPVTLPAATDVVDATLESVLRREGRYQNFLKDVTCAQLGRPETTEGADRCRDLVSLLSSGRDVSRDPRQLRFALELPLMLAPQTRMLELRFYVELILSLMGDRKPTMTLIWQTGDKSTPGSALVAFRPPSIEIFAALLRPGSSNRSLCCPGRDQPLATVTAAPALAIVPSMELADVLRESARLGHLLGSAGEGK
ncbi:type VI secretion system-associated protein TagF [Haliangium sp. UPWRP_2]|uniref:type VI secretion system-associated protein TagF n=1 Tax=Haliangium sp. UPWRP_2 TaxID=1931276 RepID=UPI000B5488C3|nr:type VI secretion system-associated protein TagF [Haliangium sp. UPWRP_2]PSM31800.1 type VI secretion system-associated protein TagF [Haliangium sp. UPWRP_2]